MKKTLTSTILVALFGLAPHVFAIDRNARMIDSIGIEVGDYTDLEYVGVGLWVENALAAPGQNWAIIAGLAGGQYSADGGDDVSSWLVGLGLKWYLTPVTGVSLVGTYRNLDNKDNFDIAAGTLSLKQRLAPSTSAISPFITASASLQTADFEPDFLSSQEDSFTAVVTTIGLGCDFMMNEELAFVFSGGLSDSEDITSGEQYADGFYVGISMQYYWD